MITAVLSFTLVGHVQAPSKLSQVATRFMSALVDSPARRGARALRRHDHSSLFLGQSELLPVKI
jgi:hypothetical protein